jgi:hypothetical protein
VEHAGAFATAINCMDGRVQLPVIDWMKQEYGVDYVDCVTEPGPIKILSENEDAAAVASIKRRLDISARVHGSCGISVVAHHDCGGNPVDRDTQMVQLASATERVRGWGYDLPIVGLWVDEHWTVHPVQRD